MSQMRDMLKPRCGGMLTARYQPTPLNQWEASACDVIISRYLRAGYFVASI